MAHPLFFVLSGERSTLPLAELRALVETYSQEAKLEVIGDRLVIAVGAFNHNSILKRAAYLRAGGTLLARGSLKEAEKLVRDAPFEDVMKRGVTFAARTLNLSKEPRAKGLEELLGSTVMKNIPSARVSLENPEQTVMGIVANGHFLIGLVDHTIKRRWFQRRARAKPYFHPSALYPKFARALVNLSRVKEGEVMLDPFCGTGSIMIEASLMGIHTVGIDIAKRMCRGARDNLRHYGLEELGIINSDALLMPMKRTSAVVTDIPYGRSASSYGLQPSSLAHDLILRLEELTPKGRYCVVVHPLTVELEGSDGVEVIERHHIYVHRKLTRIISVLRRK